MQNWFRKTLINLRSTFKGFLKYLLCIFIWQLFLTVFFFCGTNLIILIIVGVILLTNLFLIV